jgi:tetratricopeptide (TPR) repeat protein
MRAYFNASGRRVFEQTLYRTMGTLYQAQDRTADAVAAYETFLAIAPNHPDAPAFQSAVVDAYTKAKWQAALIAARERLVDRYEAGGAWARASGDTARRAARPLVKEALYQLALYDHAQAQTAKRPDTYEKAVARDDRFLSSFSDDVEAAKIAWLRAEALFELGRYDEAAAGYSRAAYDYPLHAQSREAGYAAVVASERAVPPDGPVSPRAAENLFARVERFKTAFPDDQRHADLLMKAAETAARAGLADRAYDAAQRLVTSYPSSRWTAQAKRLIGQTLYDRGQYRDAEQAFRQALAAAPGTQADALKALAAASLYQGAAAQRTKGDLVAASRLYVQVADEFPATPLAPAALVTPPMPRSKRATRRPGKTSGPAWSASTRRAIKPPGSPPPRDGGSARGDPPARSRVSGPLGSKRRSARDEIAWTTAHSRKRGYGRRPGALSVWPRPTPGRSIEAGFRATPSPGKGARRRAPARRGRSRSLARGGRRARTRSCRPPIFWRQTRYWARRPARRAYAAIRLVTPVEHTWPTNAPRSTCAGRLRRAAQLKVAG